MAAFISEHFTIEELTSTRHNWIENVASAEAMDALKKLCDNILEPIRARIGCPLQITSGYRSPALNAVVGGRPNSQHLKGEAADFIPIGPFDLKTYFAMIARSKISFDQLILEFDRWIHVSYHTADLFSRRDIRRIRSSANGPIDEPYPMEEL